VSARPQLRERIASSLKALVPSCFGGVHSQVLDDDILVRLCVCVCAKEGEREEERERESERVCV